MSKYGRNSTTIRLAFIASLAAAILSPMKEARAAEAVLSTSFCTAPNKEQEKWIGYKWNSFLPYTKVCPIRDSRGKIVVYIVSVWTKLYDPTIRPGVRTPPTPKPLVLDGDGNLMTILPVHFPYDNPNTIEIRFIPHSYGAPIELLAVVKTPQGVTLRPMKFKKKSNSSTKPIYVREW
jgi:hypothetical protein